MKTSKVRYARSKGKTFEYSCLESLQQKWPDMYLTAERGFQKQFDLCSDKDNIAVECKRHSNFSWNELIKLFYKLEKNAPDKYLCFLIIRANQQPGLVMYRRVDNNKINLCNFEDFFGVPLIKHTPIRKKKLTE